MLHRARLRAAPIHLLLLIGALERDEPLKAIHSTADVQSSCMFGSRRPSPIAARARSASLLVTG